MFFTGMRTAFRPLVVLGLVLAIAGGAWAECLTEDLTPEQKAKFEKLKAMRGPGGPGGGPRGERKEKEEKK